MKDNYVGVACATRVRDEELAYKLSFSLRIRDQLKFMVVHWRIIIKWFVKMSSEV